MKRNLPKTDIYGVTASELSRGRSNGEVVRQMLECGVKIIQYREKTLSMREKYTECREIRQLCRQFDACFIVNDDVSLALAVKADGVHVGQSDLSPEAVREIVGEDMIIGLSITEPEQIKDAIKSGVVDYFGVGPIFATATKPDAAMPFGLPGLKKCASFCRLPIVAIGGIKEANVASVIDNGADCAAIIGDIVGSADIPAKINAIRAEISGKR